MPGPREEKRANEPSETGTRTRAARQSARTNPTMGNRGKLYRHGAAGGNGRPGIRKTAERTQCQFSENSLVMMIAKDAADRDDSRTGSRSRRGNRVTAPEDEVGLDRLATGGADQHRDLAPMGQRMAVELGQDVGDDATEPVTLGALVEEAAPKLRFAQAIEVLPRQVSCAWRTALPSRRDGSGDPSYVMIFPAGVIGRLGLGVAAVRLVIKAEVEVTVDRGARQGEVRFGARQVPNRLAPTRLDLIIRPAQQG